jgi:ribosome-binding factor A
MSRHDDRATELIAHEAAKFIAGESSGQSLITVTRALLSTNAEHVDIFFSVFPPSAKTAALSFLSRSGGHFRAHLAKHTKLHPIPSITFVLDEGELNRQRLDEISRGPSGIGHA